MRKQLVLTFVLLLSFGLAARGESLREMVYLSTDRDVYVAGDALWLSAWCVRDDGRLSAFSKTAYVELHSSEGMVLSSRLALSEGRGAGRLMLPNTLPTGNYRLLAYTKLGASVEGFSAVPGSRVLSIFNTFSTSRIEGGTVLVDKAREAQAPKEHGALQISLPDAPDARGRRTLVLTNKGSRKVDFSLSVRHGDSIASADPDRAEDFISALRALPVGKHSEGNVVPEYEGEIIHAHVTGMDAAGISSLKDRYAFISSPGGGDNVYSASIREDGSVSFITSNIYGHRDLFLEIEGLGRDEVCHLELDSPFLGLDPGAIPALELCPSYEKDLELRSLGMQLEKNFDADTLYTALPERRHDVFYDSDCKSYILDDYTRFPVMEELFVEFISELRIRKSGSGKRELQVRTANALGSTVYQSNTLVLLDGVPVLDQEKIFAYDPLLVRRVDIYPHPYFLGIRGFSAVVNFVTYKGTLPSMDFEDNVRIVDFQGCPLPMAYTCTGVGDDYPDYRQTILWQPLLSLLPGESVSLECKLPDYAGSFVVDAEGFGADGSALRTLSGFEAPGR